MIIRACRPRSSRATVRAAKSGYVAQVDPMAIAQAALLLGAGRVNVSATVDHAVGITDLAKIGERVHRNDRLCTVHANDERASRRRCPAVQTAFTINTRCPCLARVDRSADQVNCDPGRCLARSTQRQASKPWSAQSARAV